MTGIISIYCYFINTISGEGNGNPLQYSCLENPMDREAWQATVHGVLKSWTQLRDFFTLGTLYFPGGLGGNESSCSVGNLGLIPGLKKSTGERNGYPL